MAMRDVKVGGAARRVARRALDLVRPRPQHAPVATEVAGAMSDADRAIVDHAQRYTMTSPERLLAVIDSVDYLVRRGIAGAFVECGVWRGGSVLAMILTLQRAGAADRDVYLFDTFSGMTEPTAEDTSSLEEPALSTWKRASSEGRRAWEWAFGEEVYGVEQVREVLLATGYPADRLHFVVGPVESTIPGTIPDSIALLRLDTDWYESTHHELVHLYPRLATSGVLIIDDYGHWDGARKAVDEYFATTASPVLLSRVDYTGRVAIKS
jgi:hypothetical protein